MRLAVYDIGLEKNIVDFNASDKNYHEFNVVAKFIYNLVSKEFRGTKTEASARVSREQYIDTIKLLDPKGYELRLETYGSLIPEIEDVEFARNILKDLPTGDVIIYLNFN